MRKVFALAQIRAWKQGTETACRPTCSSSVVVPFSISQSPSHAWVVRGVRNFALSPEAQPSRSFSLHRVVQWSQPWLVLKYKALSCLTLVHSIAANMDAQQQLHQPDHASGSLQGHPRSCLTSPRQRSTCTAVEEAEKKAESQRRIWFENGMKRTFRIPSGYVTIAVLVIRWHDAVDDYKEGHDSEVWSLDTTRDIRLIAYIYRLPSLSSFSNATLATNTKKCDCGHQLQRNLSTISMPQSRIMFKSTTAPTVS